MREVRGGVFVGTEFGRPARDGEFALVRPLFGEGEEEAFLLGFVLHGCHCLLDVVVVDF